MQAVLDAAPYFLTTLDTLWWSSLVIGVLFTLGCHLIPNEIATLQSMPWTFQWRRNLDLDFQSVTYAAYHTNALSRGTHLTLGLEALAWFTLAALAHWTLTIALLGLVITQALAMRESRFGFMLILIWLGYAVGGEVVASLIPSNVGWRLPAYFLIGAGLLRTLGHALEDIPPLIATPEDRFVPLKDMPRPSKLLFTFPAGYISEFVSAFPTRLVIVQFYWIALRCGYVPANTSTWTEASKVGASVVKEGWKAYPPVGELIAPLVERPTHPANSTREAQEVRYAS